MHQTRSGLASALARTCEFFARLVRLLSHARQRGFARERVAGLESELARTSAAIETLNAQVSHLQAAVEALSGARSANLHLPFTQRTQALKMIREGRSAKQIAAALGLSQGEVLLLSRVQDVQTAPSQSPAAVRNESESSFATALRQLTVQAGGAA